MKIFNKMLYIMFSGLLIILFSLYIKSKEIEYFSSETNEDIIIEQHWGGLGDNLQFTTLPELYSKMGHKVYISSKNAYRNNEIYDLVWKLNPYVEGISDLPQNAGSSKGKHDVGFSEEYIDSDYYFIKKIELSHGITNGYRKYPVIYYKANYIDGIDNYIFYDTTSISTNPKDSEIKKSFEDIFSKYPDLTPRRIEFTNIKNRNIPNLNHEVYKINNVYEYCDLLYSCQVFVCGYSGSAGLASAIKQDSDTPIIHSFGDTKILNEKLFRYDNINYHKWLDGI